MAVSNLFAQQRSYTIQQDTDTLAAYIAKFERILYEAHGHDWPDVNKISTFRKGLNQTLRNRLNQQLNLPRTYPNFLRITQQLASYSGSSSSNTTQRPSGVGYEDRMEINKISTRAEQLKMLQDAEATDSD